MLFDVFPTLLASISGHADQLSRLLTSVVPNIIIWEQYRSFLEWSLNGLANIFNSAGLAIIAFTIIIKTILLPLTVKSIRSSRNMQELSPKIKEIQKKYGKDRQRASQETMALYQQHGVNPMAGCLPMLIQIPIFFGLYRAIFNLSGGNVGVWADGFAWIPDLSNPDPWFILPVLAGLFQFIQIRMMRPANQQITDPQQRIMNTMMNFMPIMIVVFGWTFAAGPVLYWAAQSVYSVIQQWFITGWGNLGEWFPWLPELPDHRRLGYRPPRDPEDVVVVSGAAGAAAPQQKGFQGWMMRKMEAAQEQAQARQEERSATQKANKKGGGGSRQSDEDEGEAEVDQSVQTARDNRRSSSYQDRVNAASKFKTRDGERNGFSEPEETGDEVEAEGVLVEAGATGGSNGSSNGRVRTAYRNPRATASRAKARSRKKR